MKTLAIAFFGLAAVALTAGHALAEGDEETPKPQTMCPLTNEPINKAFYADHDGKRVYFCCAGCREAFKKDPAKYVKQLEDDGVTLEEAPVPQTMCPIMDRKINRKYFADHKGKRVYLCCRTCVRRFKRNPERYIKQLEDEGVTLEAAPSSGEE